MRPSTFATAFLFPLAGRCLPPSGAASTGSLSMTAIMFSSSLPPCTLENQHPTTSGQPLFHLCKIWAKAAPGDTCWGMGRAHCRTVAEFVRLNPSLHGDCRRLQAGEWYCVADPGSDVCETTTVTVVPLPVST
ncbi:hypothetical protein F4780DRAFT_446540 [Xylariomycetidae sp. FL0641]|nr:hypothetical protein F4780DRAFT_446540 [Xylariomycetidae sp. FL0641]